MERKEVRRTVKDYFKEKGFMSSKSCMYKIFDDDYLVGIDLDTAGFMKAYQMACFAIYLPEENLFPLTGFGELRRLFWFPETPGADIVFPAPDESPADDMTFYFEYELYTKEQFLNYLDANYNQVVTLLLDKEYGLNIYRNNWRKFAALRNDKNRIIKLCHRTGLDPQEIFDFIDWFDNKGGRYLRIPPEEYKDYFRKYMNKQE